MSGSLYKQGKVLSYVALCWQEYEGIYVYGAIQVEVKTEKNQLLLVSGSGVTGKVILAYKGPLKFQVHITGSYNYLVMQQ